jgi:peptidoglycan/LPS O-acetylase OafA/YrhL
MTKYGRNDDALISKLPSRLIEVDAVKALAIVGVLILHMSFTSRLTASTLETLGILQRVFGWAVMAFFFASGLLTRPLHNPAALADFVASRFRRLIIPCIVFSLTYKVLLLLLGVAGIGTVPNEFALAKFLLMPVGPQFYFLPLLFGISIAVALVEIWVRPPLLVYLSGCVLLSAYVWIPLPSAGHGASASLLPLYWFSYVAGRAISERDASLRARNLGIVMAFSIVAGLLYMAPVILYTCVAPLMFALFGRYAGAARFIEYPRLGRDSSAIYVWHAPVVMPMVSILCFKLFGGSLLVLLPLLILTIGLCIMLGRVTERFDILRFWRF